MMPHIYIMYIMYISIWSQCPFSRGFGCNRGGLGYVVFTVECFGGNGDGANLMVVMMMVMVVVVITWRPTGTAAAASATEAPSAILLRTPRG